MVVLEKVIEKSGLFANGDSILCATSGGPDSMALLYALYQSAKKTGYRLFAGHVNHQLRERADMDELLVQNFCKSHAIPFAAMRRDVQSEASLLGKSLEEAARDIRYECLESMRRQFSADKIALAHHQGDQAETVMFRLCRGSGIKGLCGMRPENGRFIRPFLSVSKQDLLDYVDLHQIPFVTDVTNADERYTRNYLRLTVLPALKKMNPNVEEAISRTAALACDDEDYLEEQANALLKKAFLKTGEFKVSVLLGAPLPLVRRALRQWIAQFRSKDVSFDHIEKILSILSGGGEYYLPGANRVLCSSGRMIFELHGKDGISAKKSTPLNIAGDTNFGDAVFSCRKVSKRLSVAAEDPVQYIDGDRLPSDTVIRNRKKGDIITPLGMGQPKKLKDYLIDRKIPRYVRDGLVLLCSGNHVLWVVGCGLSEEIRTTDKTKNVLCIQYIKSDCGGSQDETIC